MENTFLVNADLIGLRQGVIVPTPWRNVHQTANLRHGVRSAHSSFRWWARRGVTPALNRPSMFPSVSMAAQCWVWDWAQRGETRDVETD